MFLLNNCKLLIFGDVRHGPATSQKLQELVNFGARKNVHGRACAWARSGREERGRGLGRRCQDHQRPRDGRGWGSSIHAESSQTIKRSLATKYQLKHREKLKRNAMGKSLNPVYTRVRPRVGSAASPAVWGRAAGSRAQRRPGRATRQRQAPKAASKIPSERFGRLDERCL